MSSVIASDIPSKTTPAQVREFFETQVGKVQDLIPLGDDLSDAYIDGVAIRVDEVPELTDGQTGKAPQQQ
ncbi:hypothetical protein G210_1577 [Candida maltosa Xu316]|uniref:Uncharacterized protein n=1 Tax=Candida maltosa (strain Xu316) TaxID=1245528 RepID=M3JY88_CANMX|nr:hypothetical protein G210_1577 [Candida maltosa Xu316]